MSVVSAINPLCLKQWVASKALVDYIVTGVAVLRNAVRQEIVKQLHADASAVDRWISIFNTHGTPNSVIQIASCFLCGAVAAVMLILWLRVGNDEKEFV
jgi:hypothetical protein